MQSTLLFGPVIRPCYSKPLSLSWQQTGQRIGGNRLYQVIFWFDIVTLALMFISFGLGFAAYSRIRLRWLRSYLAYLLCYAGWLVLSTYFFFQDAYLVHPIQGLSIAVEVFRVVLSLAILLAGPVCALQIANLSVGRLGWWLLSILVAFVFGTVLVYYATGSARVAIIPNGIFNFYLGALFLLSAIRTSSSNRRQGVVRTLRALFLPFLWFSAGAYALLLAANITAGTAPGLLASPIVNVGLAAAYCFIWSLITIVAFLRHMASVGTSMGSMER